MNQQLEQIGSQLFSSNYSLIAILFVAAVVITGLLFVVFRQSRQVQQLKLEQKPRYGFLGKPLASLAVVGILAASVGVVWLGTNNSTAFRSVDAEKNIQLRIEATKMSSTNKILVKFQLIPTIDAQDWPEDLKLDAFWYISGPQTESEVELDLSQADDGGFSKELTAGTYEVKVDAITNFGNATVTQTFTFQK